MPRKKTLSQSAAKILHTSSRLKKAQHQERQITRLITKAQKSRVLKPKPERRPKERVTIITIGGQPVREIEDAFTEIT